MKMNKLDKFAWIFALFVVAVFVIAIAVPPDVWATCTYSTSSGTGYGSGTTIASCNETTELAPTLSTQGKPLNGVGGLNVTAVATGNMTAGGTLAAYLYHPSSAQWTRAPDLDLTISAAANNQTWPGIVVTVSQGRVDYRPSSAGANNTLIYIIGEGAK